MVHTSQTLRSSLSYLSVSLLNLGQAVLSPQVIQYGPRGTTLSSPKAIGCFRRSQSKRALPIVEKPCDALTRPVSKQFGEWHLQMSLLSKLMKEQEMGKSRA
jgi:hypothetical protein